MTPELPAWMKAILAQKDERDDSEAWDKPDEKPYFDKGDHKERSKFHQPNHLKFWKKQGEQ